MQFNKSLMTAALLAVGSLTAVSANAASTATSTFPVKLVVTSVCNVQANTSGIDLGTTEAGLATAAVNKGNSNIVLNCSKGALPVISLTPSNNSTTGLGEVKLGSEVVPYQLTSDSAGGTKVWGNIKDTNTVALAAAVKYATDITVPVYAAVAGDADVTPGTYLDTVTVAVTY